MTESRNTNAAGPYPLKMVMKESDPAIKITTSSLNGSNYIVWAKSASLYLCGKSKIGYINGKIKAPPKEDPGSQDIPEIGVGIYMDVPAEEEGNVLQISLEKTTWQNLQNFCDKLRVQI
ncbi:hypothetical protein EJ110_NYTH09777 [Nymphaea thermarum]|nr:hypothetical protein EJ110_NYTH09777 [Nymphaea thermarum]